MFEFFKHRLFAPIRRVVTSCIYGTALVFYVTNLILHPNIFTPTDLILVSVGTGLWGIASIQSLTRNIMLLRQEIKNQKTDNTKCLQRSSTHAIFNSLNHLASSSIFFAIDAYRLNNATPAMITRIIGTALWLKCSAISLYMAFADIKKQEDDPDAEIKIAGLKPEVIRLICDLDIFIAGVLYIYPIWTQGFPVKDVYQLSWLLASLLESINSSVMLADVCHGNDETAIVELSAVNSTANKDRTISFAVM